MIATGASIVTCYQNTHFGAWLDRNEHSANPGEGSTRKYRTRQVLSFLRSARCLDVVIDEQLDRFIEQIRLHRGRLIDPPGPTWSRAAIRRPVGGWQVLGARGA